MSVRKCYGFRLLLLFSFTVNGSCSCVGDSTCKERSCWRTSSNMLRWNGDILKYVFYVRKMVLCVKQSVWICRTNATESPIFSENHPNTGISMWKLANNFAGSSWVANSKIATSNLFYRSWYHENQIMKFSIYSKLKIWCQICSLYSPSRCRMPVLHLGKIHLDFFRECILALPLCAVHTSVCSRTTTQKLFKSVLLDSWNMPLYDFCLLLAFSIKINLLVFVVDSTKKATKRPSEHVTLLKKTSTANPGKKALESKTNHETASHSSRFEPHSHQKIPLDVHPDLPTARLSCTVLSAPFYGTFLTVWPTRPSTQ